MTWGPSGNVVYSSFAFKWLKAKNPSSNSAQSVNWSCVWSLKLPENILHFLWLTFHGSLATNMFRVFRHLSTNSFCNRCRNGEESILHVLRDGHFVVRLWSFLKLDTNVAFYSIKVDLHHWLTDNIKLSNGVLFTATCWTKWSNVNHTQNLHMDIIKAWNHTPQHQHVRFVRWVQP